MARPHPSRTGGPGHRVAAEQGGSDTLEPFLYASISDFELENVRLAELYEHCYLDFFFGTMNSLFILCTRRPVLHSP